MKTKELKILMYKTIVAVFLFVFVASGTAHAQCASPVGAGGDILYNVDNTVLQYCDNTDWIGIGGAGSLVIDADGDTQIQVEESADDDTIRFDTLGMERMIIDNAGNVGIGGTTSQRLEVHGHIQQQNGDTLRAKDSGGTAETWMWPRWTNDWMYTNYGANGWIIRDNTSVERMRIDATGQLGIGISPAQSLHTTGNIRTDGRYIYFGPNQYLYGGNSAYLYFRSDHSTVSGQIFYDKENTLYGYVYGSGNGSNFGLLDGDGNWSYQAQKDSNTIFRINNNIEMRLYTNRLDMYGNYITALAYYHSSDERLKENIETVDGLGIISKLRGVSYNWKKDGAAATGVVAQEVEKIMPQAVTTDDSGMKSVDYDQIIAPLIEAVKEQQAQIKKLQKRLETMEGKE